MRTALGASRSRVVRLFVAEGALLAIGSAVVGIAATLGGIALFRDAGAAYFPRMAEVALNGPTLGVLAALTGASALLFGVIPAFHGASGGRSVAAPVGGLQRNCARVRDRVLVGSPVAIATPLLIAAALLSSACTSSSASTWGSTPAMC